MPIKLIVIASLVAMASSDLGYPVILGHNVGHGSASPAAPHVHVFPALPATFVLGAAPKTDSNIQKHVKDTDPALIAAYNTHKAFMEKEKITSPYHYSYGYEFYDWKTDLTETRYESRYGDVAMGTYIIHTSDGNRTIVDYTVDTPTGFHGVLRKDFQVQPTSSGYARLAGPLAYASHPALEEYASRTTLLADPAANESPIVKSTYKTHNNVIYHFSLSAPFNVSLGYDVIDSHTGLRRTQYEKYYGETGEGSSTQVAADGTRSSIDYSISPAGFAVTSAQIFTLTGNPVIQAPSLG